jgi:hypothetical protein
MYDKYAQANQFSLGSSKLPKHKGILFTGATASTPASTLHVVKLDGSTASLSLVVNQSPYILPMQVYAVTALAGGVTAWYIN